MLQTLKRQDWSHKKRKREIIILMASEMFQTEDEQVFIVPGTPLTFNSPQSRLMEFRSYIQSKMAERNVASPVFGAETPVVFSYLSVFPADTPDADMPSIMDLNRCMTEAGIGVLFMDQNNVQSKQGMRVKAKEDQEPCTKIKVARIVGFNKPSWA